MNLFRFPPKSLLLHELASNQSYPSLPSLLPILTPGQGGTFPQAGESQIAEMQVGQPDAARCRRRSD